MKEIEVFIAGSKTITVLRDSARAALMEISNRYRDFNTIFRPYTFEDFPQAVAVGGQQAEYNKYISEKADYVIFIFDEGFGEKTMEELEIAMESFKKKQRPGIYIYCNEKKVETNLEEYEKVLSWCRENKQYYISYEDGTFKDKVKYNFSEIIKRQSDDQELESGLAVELKKTIVEELWYALSNATKEMFSMIQWMVDNHSSEFDAAVEGNRMLMSALRKAKVALPAELYGVVMDFAIDVPQKGFNWVLAQLRKYEGPEPVSISNEELAAIHKTLVNDVVNLKDAQVRINKIQTMLMDYCNNVLVTK